MMNNNNEEKKEYEVEENINNQDITKKISNGINGLVIGAAAIILAIGGYKLCKESPVGDIKLDLISPLDGTTFVKNAPDNTTNTDNNSRYDYKNNEFVVADSIDTKTNDTKFEKIVHDTKKTDNFAFVQQEQTTPDIAIVSKDKQNKQYDSVIADYPGTVCFARRDDGGIFIQKENTYTIGIPENYYGQSMNTIIFFDMEIINRLSTLGEERYNLHQYEDGTCIFQEDMVDLIMNQNPDTLVVVSHFGVGNNNANEILSILDSIGANSEHTIVSGFSAGGNMAIETTEEIVKNHNNLGNPEVLLIDCNHTTQIQSSIDFLGKHKIKCTLLHQLNDLYLRRNYEHIINSGMDFAVINLLPDWLAPYKSQHLAKKDLAINCNYFGYILGNTPAPLDYDYSNTTPPFEYLHYDLTTGNFERTTPNKTITDGQSLQGFTK